MPNILIHDPPCMLPLSSKLKRHVLKHLEEEWLKLCCHLNDDHWMMVFLWWWKRETCSTTCHMYHTCICDHFRHLKSTRYGFHLVFTFWGMFTFHFDFQLSMQAFFFFSFFSLEYGLPWPLHFEEWSSNLTQYIGALGVHLMGILWEKNFLLFFK